MSNGIDFVIGGKDKAAPAMSSVEKSLARLEKKTEEVGNATRRLTAITGGLAAAYGALKAGLALLGGLDKLNAAYDQQANAVKGLETALKLQGASVDTESARLQAFASDMQKLNGVGDEVTLGLMQQAAMMGTGADQLDDMASAAIGLSEATGKGLSESLKLVRQAAEGEFGAFGELMPQIKSMTTAEEKLAAVMDLSRKGLEAKADASNTVAGMSERASGAFGDLLESVGALLAPFRMLINQGIKTLSEYLTTLLVPAVEWATTMLENIGPMMEWLQGKILAAVNVIVTAFTFLEVALTNLDTIWRLMVSQAELYMLQLAGAVMHALTVTIPEYAKWFADNFVNIMKDAFNAVVTVVTNAGEMIGEAFWKIFEFIKSGMAGGMDELMADLGEIAGRSLLDGFEATTEALPDLAARQITDREKELAKQVGEMGAALGDEFQEKLKRRLLGQDGGVMGELEAALDLSIGAKPSLAKGAGKAAGEPTLRASEGRLITRGPASKQLEVLEKTARSIENLVISSNDILAANNAANEKLGEVAENTEEAVMMVPVQ